MIKKQRFLKFLFNFTKLETLIAFNNILEANYKIYFYTNKVLNRNDMCFCYVQYYSQQFILRMNEISNFTNGI